MFNPLRTNSDCSPKISFTITDGALTKLGYENLFKVFRSDLVNCILVINGNVSCTVWAIKKV